MAISWDSFDKIWASTSPLTPYSFSDPTYAQGWNFVGSTPPARQMWDSIQKQNDEKFKYLRDNFGTPNIVTSSSQMTDTEKVYVYMGSEAGWNSGHWYYYDEGTSSWADGGVYNSVAFVTDTTLSIAGQPADAKAVGDALALKADLAGCTFTGNVTVGADFSVTGDTSLVDANVTDLTATNVNTTDIVVSGDATIGGNVGVMGDISSANITTTADGTIGGNLSVSGTTTLTGDAIVSGDSALTNLSVSGTTALTGTSTAPTPSADDNSTKIATTEYVQTEIKPIETDVDIAQKDIANIKALLQGHLYDYQTDSTSAYTKSVPSGAMPYAGLESLGGKTVVWNQLVDSGTTTVNTISGHKYYTLIDGTASIVTSDGSAISIVDDTADMVCDLTLMYGSGNEPSTVQEFTAQFPASYYPYNAGQLLSAGVTEVVSKKADTTTIATYPIPAEIQALDGYGWSAGSVYNYIDYERKVFVKCVDKVVLNGTQTLTANWRADASGVGWYYQYNLTNNALPPDNFTIGNIVSDKMMTQAYSGLFNHTVGIGLNPSADYGIFIWQSDTSLTTVSAINTYMSNNPITVYYELATPIETDISEYLTDDNLINVESGGTLTFPNSNGTDYQIPVPSTEEYMIDIQSALGG